MLELLIVDDESDILDILESVATEQRVLIDGEAHDVRVTRAANGREAFELVQTNWFDAILSDIKMPIMDGLDLLANIRGLGKEVPLIFLTAFGDKEHAVRALRLGCYDFLDKPINLDRLRDVIHRALESGFRGREIEQEIEVRLSKLAALPAERYRQLRLVFRSMILVEKARAEKTSAVEADTESNALGALLGHDSSLKKQGSKTKKKSRRAA